MTGLAIDEERGELYVANDMGNSILVFNVTHNGDIAPKGVIKGPKTHIANPTGIWIDPKNKEVWVTNFMNHSATAYPLGASGDVAPLRIIRSGPPNEPALGIGNPHPVAYDTKREQILVLNQQSAVNPAPNQPRRLLERHPAPQQDRAAMAAERVFRRQRGV